ncbi:NADH dehydrogenase [ubiquinone] 1 beta subcomplex subunit 4 [Salminus brasiliensis]|uniref:NADH dehydrogenase [ubiquinone] 1 beta subcomplex subunit 4 n=1 Tax=Salminus brasiliensis TaxID=930266 RepID=UPI003B82CD8C
MANYKGSSWASVPKTLDPAEYFNLSPEYRQAEEQRAEIRAKLKRQYQLQLNNPLRKHLIEDPALTRWTYARTNVYPNTRATPKTSLLGLIGGVAPLFLMYFLLKTDRDIKEQRKKDGTLKYPFAAST